MIMLKAIVVLGGLAIVLALAIEFLKQRDKG
jgi:hypothetical protein